MTTEKVYTKEDKLRYLQQRFANEAWRIPLDQGNVSGQVLTDIYLGTNFHTEAEAKQTLSKFNGAIHAELPKFSVEYIPQDDRWRVGISERNLQVLMQKEHYPAASQPMPIKNGSNGTTTDAPAKPGTSPKLYHSSSEVLPQQPRLASFPRNHSATDITTGGVTEQEMKRQLERNTLLKTSNRLAYALLEQALNDPAIPLKSKQALFAIQSLSLISGRP